jgi:GNAT superfamily N-acetyltransferase
MEFSIECASGTLSVSLLSEQQVHEKYLPLRFDVLHSELGYDHGTVSDPEGFLDRYDRYSLHYGVFKGSGTLIGAARVIIPFSNRDFPSYKFVADKLDNLRSGTVVCELSRMLVDRPYRGRGLFQLLFVTALLIARDRGADWLIISERDDKRFHDFLISCNFRRITSDYWFCDERIAPTVKSASYLVDVHTELTDNFIEILLQQRADLLRDLQNRLIP